MRPNGSLHPQVTLEPKSLLIMASPPTDILIPTFHSIMTLGYNFNFSIYSLIHPVLEKMVLRRICINAAISFHFFSYNLHVPHSIQLIPNVHLLTYRSTTILFSLYPT